MNINETWETVFRKHRLHFVTTLQEDVLTWLSDFTIYHHEQIHGRNFSLHGKVDDRNEIEIKFLKSIKNINIIIKENDQRISTLYAIIPTAQFKKTNLNQDETRVLKDFFLDIYTTYQKEVIR